MNVRTYFVTQNAVFFFCFLFFCCFFFFFFFFVVCLFFLFVFVCFFFVFFFFFFFFCFCFFFCFFFCVFFFLSFFSERDRVPVRWVDWNQLKCILNNKNLNDCLWKQKNTFQIENGRLDFIETLHKQ